MHHPPIRLRQTSLTRLLLLLALSCASPNQPYALAHPANPQGAKQLYGEWTGESICQVKNSPCHDEKAIYRITPAQEKTKVTIDLGKIVNGQAESMIVHDFDYDQARQTLICAAQYGTWQFHLVNDKLEGTLTTPAGVLYRRISVKRVSSSAQSH
jgi:hypothetical protein